MRALHRARLIATVGAAVLTGLLTTAGQASAAENTATPGHPAVTQRGEAYAGWHEATAANAATPDGARVQDISAAANPIGIDVSSYQGNVDWASYWNQGYRFAYTKATEGDYYTSDYFSQQYTGSYNQGFIRGAYHFGIPNGSSGASQAQYFVSHGGGWSADGKTLPGMLDMEFNPYGATCYGLSQAALTNWIKDFTNTYRSLSGRDAVIYTNTGWWNQCVNSSAFGATNPLWVANYSSSTPPVPAGWGYYTFHQYSSDPVDQNRFNGTMDRLIALATG